MRTIIGQLYLPGEGTILSLDGPIPMKAHSKYRIDGVDYQIAPLYDLPNCIAIRESGEFVGKTVEFVNPST